MTSNADILRLKKELQTLKAERPQDFEKMMEELNGETKDGITPEFVKIMERNFDRFEETFKALA
jgi:hypothetical protein